MSQKCPNCAGTLLFSPSRQAMYCRMCGATFAPEEVGATDYAAPTYNCSVYSCANCGGEIAVNGTEAATLCLFCGSPNVIFNRTASRRRPDGILPFSITKKRAKELIEEHIAGGRMVPESVKCVDEKNICGIYLPYRLLSCDFHDAVLINSKIRRGKHTRNVVTGMAGFTEFNNIPLDSSLSVNDEYSKKLEPFKFDDIREFDEDYMSGFYSDAQDAPMEDLRKVALKRCDTAFGERSMRMVRGTEPHVTQSYPSIKFRDDGLYVLMPCWFYTFTYEGKPYTLLVNGQTGKTTGTIPWNKKKFIRNWILLFIGLSVVCSLPFFFMDRETLYAIGRVTAFYLAPMFSVVCFVLGMKKMNVIKRELRMTQDRAVFKFVNRGRE